MRVGVYSNISQPSACGGAAQALLSLLKALAKYSSTDDQFILFGPNEGAEWLSPVLSERVRLVQPPAKPGGAGWYKLQKWRRHFDLSRRPRLEQYFGAPENGYTRQTSHASNLLPAVSTGFIESHQLDVIHFPYQEFVVTSLPSVFNPHDLQHVHLPGFWSPEMILWKEMTYRFACNCATKVAVAFPWVADDLIDKFGLSPTKIATVPWGGPSDAWPEASDEQVGAVRARYGLPQYFVFYPAVPWPHKNHQNLLRCMRVLKNRGSRLRLVLSGGKNLFNQAAWSDLQNTIVALGLSDAIKVIGYVPTEDMRAIYRAASIVVVPTLFEAGSGPMAEAWADGVPVACSDIPMLRGQAEDGAVFFDPLNPEDMADVVERLEQDDQLCARVVEAGRRRSRFYTWERTAHGYLDVYRDLAGRNPRV